jgi:FlaA1/EpsC-like NDP-sugar epimerase
MLISERPQTKTGTKIDILPLNRRQRQILITAALLVGDFLTLIAAFSLAYILRFILLPYERTFSVEGYGEVVRTFSLEGYVIIVAAIIPLWLLIFAINQLYSSQILFGGFEEYIRVFYSVTIGTLVIVVWTRFDSPFDISYSVSETAAICSPRL